MILDGLRDGRHRVIGLGRADDRYFTFTAGLGLDAAVVRRVEQARLRGRTSTPALYVRSIDRAVLLGEDRKSPPLSIERPGEEAEFGSGHRHHPEHRPVDLRGRPPDQPQPRGVLRPGA